MTAAPPFRAHTLAPAQLLAEAEAALIASLSGDAVPMTLLLHRLQHLDEGHPLGQIIATFRLSPPEAMVLLALASANLCPEAAAHLGRAGADGQGVPLWLILRLIPDAGPLIADGVLTRFALITCAPGIGLSRRLSLSQCMTARTAGADPVDEPLLAPRLTPLTAPEGIRALDPAPHLAPRGPDALPPVLLLPPPGDPMPLVAGLAALGLHARLMRAADLPETPEARAELAALWSREAALDSLALILDAPAPHAPGLAAFLERVVGHVAVMGCQSLPAMRRLTLRLPDSDGPPDLLAPWLAALGPLRAARLGPGLSRIADAIRLPPREIAALATRIIPELDRKPPAPALNLLWHQAARALPDPGLPGVTLREPQSGWGNIILSERSESALRRLADQIESAPQVFDTWGFSSRTGLRGRGMSVLICGPSGTGKTLAAEVLAHALDLRMLVIDIGRILSKYIGETAQHLADAFAFAENSGAMIVLNEGDGLLGQRGAVGRASDRQSNAEIGDLLQRFEEFSGVSVVTTNLRSAIDPAFLRRFRAILDFAPPAQPERLRLWQGAFPKDAPLAVDAKNWEMLAALDLTGAAIHGIALNAAFRAAAAERAITPADIGAELAAELRKSGQPLPALDWIIPDGGGAA